ncbi:MAG: hypothetical protein H2045_10520 [Rhizobiales bacterium]|nr:hypothetical protein [Hyphomicrobiales bacterium]
MNRYLMIGRSNLGHQRVDVHAVALFRCDVARGWNKSLRWLTGLFSA